MYVVHSMLHIVCYYIMYIYNIINTVMIRVRTSTTTVNKMTLKKKDHILYVYFLFCFL